MTFINDTRPSKPAIIGPYSVWPRRRLRRRPALFAAGGAASVGIFLHCILPILAGA